MAGQEFPSLDSGNVVIGQVDAPSLRRDVPEGLEGLAAHMDAVGSTLQGMAEKAAVVEGQNAGEADAANGAISPRDQTTAFGASYNQAAKQSLEAQHKAALIEGMGAAYAANPDNPAALTTALQAVKAGMGATPYGDVNQSLDNEFALQHADLMNKAQLGLRQTMTQTQAAAFQTAEQNAAGTLSQLASAASLDSAGAAKVTDGISNYISTIAKFGPPTAFTINGQEIPADPNRTGVLSPEVINGRALAAVAEAKTAWITSAQIAQPGAAAQARFADDLRARYEAGDPIFAGLNGAEAARLFSITDAQASKAGQDERIDQAVHAQSAEQMIEALQWGAPVDTNRMIEEAQASGNAGLVARAQTFASLPITARGVLKTVLARQLGLLPSPGQGLAPVALDANGRPIAPAAAPITAPVPGQSAVADQIRGFAGQAGASPAEANTLVKFAQVESSLNPAPKPNGLSQGLFQFRPGTWAGVGGGDINSVHDQTVGALKLLRQDTADLTQALGRPPTEGELYLAHQQGAAGAKALLSAPPGTNAAAALVGAGVYHNLATADAAIARNGGTPATTAGDFAAHWTGRFDGSAGASAAAPGAAGADPWALPPGATPGTPAYIAWANTKAGFTADPIKFAAENGVVTVRPLVPQAALSQDPAQVGPWGDAIRSRLAAGQFLQAHYLVPLRIFTDGEKDDYKSILQQSPEAVVGLAQRLTTAIGPAGATAALREIGADGDVNTAIHIGNLAALGNRAIAASAAQGLALKAQGAKPVAAPGYEGLMTSALRDLGPAFAYDPAVLTAARNTADLARLADNQKGIDHDPSYYLQSALGAARGPDGQLFGGVAKVNGQSTLLPSWLSQDHATDALTALGTAWQRRNDGNGPVYSNGQAMSPSDVGKLRMIERPGGTYLLMNPSSGLYARNARGALMSVNFDAVKGWLTGQLPPGAVRR